MAGASRRRNLKAMVEGQLNQMFSDKIRLADWLRNSGNAHQIDTALSEADCIRARLEFSNPIENTQAVDGGISQDPTHRCFARA